MNRFAYSSILSIALLFSAAANLAHFTPNAKPLHQTTILSQTGGDPEPIDPPANGGH